MAAARVALSRGRRAASSIMMRNSSPALRFCSSSSCPFSILGIPNSSSYSDVKKAFIQLALKHHPDTRSNQDDTVSFQKIRQAFESICDNGNGKAALVNDSSNQKWTNESLDDWFYRETGQHFFGFCMDSKTRQEVANVSQNMSPGGLDKGGMWEMANAIAKQQASGINQEDPLQVTSGAGISADGENGSSSIIRGRRRRKK